MGIFKKLFPDDTMNDEEMPVLQGYQDADEPDDGYKPKPQFVLAKPEKREDLIGIADSLLDRKTVILNLEYVPNETRRFVDFLSGVAYANDGEIKKIAKSTFIITPYNVDVMGDLLYELENNGVYFV